PANNQTLGQRRAEAVMAALLAEGIAKERLTTISHGEDQPIADNSTPEGKYLNRRVVFTLKQ
ncbi:MAG: OmpA family protein, partial [Bacteroidota bacterium]